MLGFFVCLFFVLIIIIIKTFCSSLNPFSFSDKLAEHTYFKPIHRHIKCSNEIRNSYKQLNWALSASSLLWHLQILRDLKDAVIASGRIFHMLRVTKRTSLTQLQEKQMD